MTEQHARLIIPVLLGSVRRDRQGIRAARFVVNALKIHGHEAVLIDPMELKLPLLDRMYKEYAKGEAPPPLDALATLYRRADAFVIVSGEYNHSIPPALSNLLDHFLEEYFWRPSAIVSYSAGPYGGVRAAMQLRMMLAELGMSSIPSLMPIPRIAVALDEQGKPTEERLEQSLQRFLAELFWHARALKHARAAEPPPY
ncbi:NADPH-dependent oxidoreductase [Pararobbsia alpina]|uniref:NADPH-dependent FMN reductase n=1 Tax=Pararobbsia alpina TaxID=621374 RepID=UPI0039A45E4B